MPETLKPIEVTHALSIKELENPPYYTQCETRIIAFSIAFEGSIQLIKYNDEKVTEGFTYQPRIRLCNTDYDLLENFFKIVKLGKIGKEEQPRKPETQNPSKEWHVASMQECLFLLTQITSLIPSRRKKRVAELLMKFLGERISQVRKAIEQRSRTVEPYTQNAHDIYKLIKKLNKRGR